MIFDLHLDSSIPQCLEKLRRAVDHLLDDRHDLRRGIGFRFAEVAAEEELRGALVDAIEIRRRDRLEELPHDDRILRDRSQDVVRLFKAGIDIRTEAARPGGLVDMVVQRVYLHSHDTAGRRRLPDDPVLVFLVVGHLLLILEVCILLRLRCSITSFVVDSKAS